MAIEAQLKAIQQTYRCMAQHNMQQVPYRARQQSAQSAQGCIWRFRYGSRKGTKTVIGVLSCRQAHGLSKAYNFVGLILKEKLACITDRGM